MVMNNKVLFHLEACFDLISRSSLHMKIQIMGRKISENLGFKSPLLKDKNCLAFFSFHFQMKHKKLHIFVFNHFWIPCFTNQILTKTKIFNMFYLISNQLKKVCIKKWLNKRYPLSCEEFENEKKKEQKKIYHPMQRFEPQIFSNFTTHDLNFHGKWGAWNQIKTSFYGAYIHEFSLLFYSPTTVLFICTLVVEVLKMGTKTNEPLLQQNWSWCCSLQIQQLPFLRWAVLGFIAAAPCASPAWCLACSREKF